MLHEIRRSLLGCEVFSGAAITDRVIGVAPAIAFALAVLD